MRTLFLAWQDPDRRRWYPIGRLTAAPSLYTFAYTKGAEEARTEAGFQPLASFPDLSTTYVSEHLFPLFTNRVLTQARPDYQEYLDWLSVPPNEHDPVAILARSGGKKVTDALEVFPQPERDDNGQYHTHFVLHGLSQMPTSAVERAARLTSGEQLLVMRDMQNPYDPNALALRTAETYERDMHILGYIPQYLRGDVRRVTEMGYSANVTVARVNLPPAPAQYRVMCSLVMDWPTGFEPLSEPEYQPLVPQADEMTRMLAPHQGH